MQSGPKVVQSFIGRSQRGRRSIFWPRARQSRSKRPLAISPHLISPHQPSVYFILSSISLAPSSSCCLASSSKRPGLRWTTLRHITPSPSPATRSSSTREDKPPLPLSTTTTMMQQQAGRSSGPFTGHGHQYQHQHQQQPQYGETSISGAGAYQGSSAKSSPDHSRGGDDSLDEPGKKRQRIQQACKSCGLKRVKVSKADTKSGDISWNPD